VISGAFAYLYLNYIPEIINNQIELRTSAIAESFSGVVKKPLLVRHYLQVNKEAKRVSKLPGVAYASVVNQKGIVLAGFFSDLTRFERQFEMRVKEKGFPASVLAQNKLGTGDGHARITVGGQTIYDTVVAIPGSGGVVHVGIYISEVDGAIRNALVSPTTLAIIIVIVLIGFLILFFLTRTITRPMQDLTDVANRISLGELDLVVIPTGPSEMRELATAFERMRFSIKAAVDRLRK
jgi:methyl-accepting chemotaxis protein